jgi:hypothetical protein
MLLSMGACVVLVERTEQQCLRRAVAREAGFGMVDVMIAVAILMVMLIPVDRMVVSTNKAVYNNRSEVEVANYVSGVLNEDNAAATVSAWTGTGNTLAPTLPTTASPYNYPIAGISYTVAWAGGWCAIPSLASSTWTSGAAVAPIPSSGEPEGYWVVVKVTLPNSSFPPYYAALELPVPESDYASAPTTASSCPADI